MIELRWRIVGLNKSNINWLKNNKETHQFILVNTSKIVSLVSYYCNYLGCIEYLLLFNQNIYLLKHKNLKMTLLLPKSLNKHLHETWD